MSKIKITSVIKSSNNAVQKTSTLGILKDDVIKYKDNGIKTLLIINGDSITLERTSDMSNLVLKFKPLLEVESTYVINDLKMTLKLKTKTKSLDIKNNKIKINYDLYINEEYSDSFEYELSWED